MYIKIYQHPIPSPIQVKWSDWMDWFIAYRLKTPTCLSKMYLKYFPVQHQNGVYKHVFCQYASNCLFFSQHVITFSDIKKQWNIPDTNVIGLLSVITVLSYSDFNSKIRKILKQKEEDRSVFLFVSTCYKTNYTPLYIQRTYLK